MRFRETYGKMKKLVNEFISIISHTERRNTMNEVLETIRSRRSIRSYKSDPVPRELIEQVLEAGMYAPTGKGMQSPIILAVTDKAVRDKLSAMNAKIMGSDSDPFYGAPVVLVVLADRSMPNHVYDGTLVMENLMLAAHSLGLGSCWINRAREEFDSAEGKALLKKWGIEGDWVGVGHCILGYPAAEPKPAAPRKPDYIVKV